VFQGFGEVFFCFLRSAVFPRRSAAFHFSELFARSVGLFVSCGAGWGFFIL
jgi:hypothetical protein